MRRIVLTLALGVALGCAGVHHFHPNFYSVDGDIRLGQQISKEIEGELTLVRHAALLKLVGAIGQRLKEASPEPAFKLFPYSFHVVDSPEVNAFALPGGPVYVNTGIIELCDSEDQLASVLAHEMSHVAARHATEMLTTENITQLALIAAISVVPIPIPPIAWEGAKLGYVLGLLRYSRGKEAEADRLGITLMNAAGYDPGEMATVFRKLAEQQRSLPSVVERFTSSHPRARRRGPGGTAAPPRRHARRVGAALQLLAGEADVREGLRIPVGVLARPVPRIVTSLVLSAMLLVACGGLRGPVPDAKEHVRGEHFRLVSEPPDRLWPGVVHALEAEGFQLRRAEQARGFIITGYHERSPEVVKKLGEIGDLSAARQAGLGRVSELEVTYQLFLLPADEGTRLKITSTIEAIDRSEAIFLGPGILQVIPRRITIPSRGVVERDLMRRLAADLFTAEETLLLLGEPGVD